MEEWGAGPVVSELELQALWFAGQLGREFVTLSGESVKVVQFGHWNHAAGPDFLHAVVEIGGETCCGTIELDHRASDWEAHGHAQNESFNRVVLHVVFEEGGPCVFTRTSEHREIPRVVVAAHVLEDALDRPRLKVARAHPGRCCSSMGSMTDGDVERLLLEAAKHRMRRKARWRMKTVEAQSKDEWLWQALATTMGYRPNRLAMTLLAQRLPIRLLLDRPEQAEALLFGVAGFLSAEIYDQAEGDSREYLRGLWESWWRLRADYELIPERQIPWRLAGIRPVNHPQRRLACLAGVVRQWAAFRRACQHVQDVESFLLGLGHPYWNWHFTLTSQTSARRMVLVGKQRVREFVVNHLLPLRLAADDQTAWRHFMKIPAPVLSEKVDVASCRLWGNHPQKTAYLKKAWQHQALLQIYQDFCLQDISDCQQCPFPEQLGQWREGAP